MKRRLLSILLVLCMVLALLPGTAKARETSGSCGDNLTWSYNDGTLTIQGTGPMDDYMNSYGRSPWRNNDYESSLHTVKISDGATSIGGCAFSECYKLASVTIPNSVTSINDQAFLGCNSLTSVAIPASVTYIGSIAFLGCNNLTDVYYAGSAADWASIKFDSGNDALFNATIHYNGAENDTNAYPVSGGKIYFDAVTGTITDCDESVIEAIIPSEIGGVPVTSVGDGAFHACYGLTNVAIPNSVTTIGNTAFCWCTNLTNVTIPDSVTTIGSSAFDSCIGLTSVTIPDSVTQIEISAFWECNSLTDVYYGGSENQWKQISVEGHNDSLTNATIHYNSAVISTPSTPTQTTPTPRSNAVLSPQKLTVYGLSVECEKYNIGGSNYFKLRDLAYVLNGTASQFEVGFNAATSTVTITTGAAYTANGSELAAGVDNASTAQTSRQTILIDGVERSDLTAYNIGGSNFFQLRELGAALGFEVDFDAASNTAIIRSAQ